MRHADGAPGSGRGRSRRNVVPRAHWALFGLLIVLLTAGLGLTGYASHRVGQASTGPGRGVAALRAGSGPLLDLGGPEMRSAHPPARTVALTFDDGPDPTWTPKILALLRRHHVPATFFFIGARVADHPRLARRTLAAGNEVGSHTFSHANPTSLPGWERSLQLSLTQTALAGAAGIHTNLFRPPYSSTPDAVTGKDLAAYRAIARQGYLIVLSDLDSEDWRRPGVARIVRASTPTGGHGAVVLMHDGGGDRRETLDALEQLIPALKHRGYRFSTVSGMMRGDVAPADGRVGRAERFEGHAVVALQRGAGLVARSIQTMLIVIGLLAVGRAAVVVALARAHSSERRRRLQLPDPRMPVTVIVPAHNEEAGIAAAARSLRASDHPDVEVIVVDDGSTDATAEIVRSLGDPGVRLITRPNGGKPAALNTGIAAASHDIIVMVDGDTVFQPDTITNLLGPFADPRIGAVSGNTKVGNRRGLLGRWQHIEYVMGFNLDRRMYERLDCMPTVPGAVGAFRREALDAVGGVSGDTLAEDTDLTMAINRAGWRVVYEETAVAWTEAPASVRSLWRQRYRWSFGTMQAMWKHRGAIGDRQHPGIGRRALPYLVLFQILLPLLAPLIDVYGIYGLMFLNPIPVLAAWLGFSALQVGIAAYAFHLDNERLTPLWALVIQQFVYRQLMELVVLQSIVTAVMGIQLPWQRVTRTGT
ncbi:MAG: polysaccharide deacetylase, partial [Acidimicrobiales bacterium]|nr:polysaccharide deacetylase [Acidimicrobiales bacterium]